MRRIVNELIADPKAKIDPMDVMSRMLPPPGQDDSLFAMAKDFAVSLWRRRLVIAVAAGLGLAVSLYLVATTPPTFVATAVAAFEVGQVDLLDEAPPTERAPSPTALNTEIQILTSRTLAEKVIKALDLENDPDFNPFLDRGDAGFSLRSLIAGALGGGTPPREPTAEEIRQRTVDSVLAAIQVRLVGASFAFSVRAETSSAERSAQLANAVVDTYIAERSVRRLALSEGAAEAVSRRLAALQDTLRRVEQEVAVRRAEAPPGAESDLVELSRQITAVRETADAADLRRRDAEERIVALAAARARGDEEASFEAASASWLGETRRDLLDLRAALAAGDPTARVAFQTRLDAVASALTDAAAAAAQRAEALRGQVDSLQAEYDRQSRALIDLREYERQATATRSAYETLLTRLRERSTESSVDPLSPEARLLSAAVPPRRPDSPRKPMLIAFGLIGGTAIGFGVALLLNALNPSVGSAAELARTVGVPPMARLPLPRRQGAAAVLEQLRRGRLGALGSEVRNLVAEVALRRGDRSLGVVLVTTPVSTTGRAQLAATLAQAIAQTGRRTVLVDADLSSLRTSGRKRSAAPIGLEAVLSGAVSLHGAIQTDPAAGIDRLPSRGGDEQALRLLSSAQLEVALRNLAETYDAVIVETAPVVRSCDARFVAPHADLVLIAVREAHDRPEDVRTALSLVSGTGRRVGFVLLADA